MSTSVPPHTHSWEEAVTHGFFGDRTDPYPDSLYVPGVQADTDPTVSGIAPATGPEAGGTAVVITGTLLYGAPVVTFGGQAAAVTPGDGTSVEAISPPGTGVVDVVVTTQGGTVTQAAAFTYEAPPPPEESPEA